MAIESIKLQSYNRNFYTPIFKKLSNTLGKTKYFTLEKAKCIKNEKTMIRKYKKYPPKFIKECLNPTRGHTKTGSSTKTVDG